MMRASEKQLLPLLAVVTVVGLWAIIFLVSEPETLRGAATTSNLPGYTGDHELLYGNTVVTSQITDGGTRMAVMVNPPPSSDIPHDNFFVYKTAHVSLDGDAWQDITLEAVGDQTGVPYGWIKGAASKTGLFIPSEGEIHVAAYTCREYDTFDYANMALANAEEYAAQLKKNFDDQRYGYACGIDSFKPLLLTDNLYVNESNWRLHLARVACTAEVCDGVDNDCDGNIDEVPEALCSATNTCIAGVCTPMPPTLSFSGSAFIEGDSIDSTVTYHDVTKLEGCSAVLMVDGNPGSNCAAADAVWRDHAELTTGDWVAVSGTQITNSFDTTGLTSSYTIEVSFRDTVSGAQVTKVYTIN